MSSMTLRAVLRATAAWSGLCLDRMHWVMHQNGRRSMNATPRKSFMTSQRTSSSKSAATEHPKVERARWWMTLSHAWPSTVLDSSVMSNTTNTHPHLRRCIQSRPAFSGYSSAYLDEQSFRTRRQASRVARDSLRPLRLLRIRRSPSDGVGA